MFIINKLIKIKYLINIIIFISVFPFAVNAKDQIELDFMVFETPNLPAEFWDDAIARTVKDFPEFKINKIVPPNVGTMGDYLKQLKATDQFPDVMMSNFAVAEFIEAGLLLPYEDEDLVRFVDPVGLGLTNGKQYALPQLTVVESLMFYNKDMFNAAGISEEPKTWEDLMDAATKLKSNNITPFIVGGAAGDSWAAAWPLMDLVALNVTGKDKDFLKDLKSGKRNFSNPLMKSAIDAYSDLVKKGWTNSTALSLNYAELQQTFLSGDGAMYPMGGFFAGAVPLDHPFEIGVFAIPALDGSSRLVTYTSGGPAISASTEYPEAARKFAVEFATNVATNADDLFRDAHIPNNKNFDLERDMKGYEIHPLIFEIIEILQTPNFQHVPFFTFEVGDDALVAGMQAEVFSNSQEILSGKATSEIIENLNNKIAELQ
jgi:ABC-type glycerol-3-phosphate transport system substrate-binding protein